MADDLRVSAGNGRQSLESIIERYNDHPDRCTIFDPEGKRSSTWITATEGSYVHLCVCR